MDNIIRGGHWWFDTVATWRTLDEVELPDFKRDTEKLTAGGGFLALDVPMEFSPLAAKIKMKSNDPEIRALCGREPGDWITCYYYEHLKSLRDGSSRGRIIAMKGLVNELKQETVKGMKPAGVEYGFGSIVYYHDMFDGRTVHKLDWFNNDFVRDGERVFATHNRLLAIPGAAVAG